MKTAAVWVLMILWIAAPAMAKDKASKSKSKEEPVGIERPLFSDGGMFTDDELDKIRNYYRNAGQSAAQDGQPKKQKNLPPGLQKKVARGGELPPGWQKKVARGEVLDTEIYKLSESIPEDLRRQLPKGPPGTEVIRTGEKVIRVMEATREILDVLDL